MRILVVDDDELAAEMSAAVLEDGGFEVATAISGAVALEVLAIDHDFRAVVSDLNMPEMSGLELFRALRGRGLTLPFILLSGDDPEALRRQEPGLSACVGKDAELETTLISAVIDALLPAEG